MRLAAPGRLWPQKVRTRLAVLYAALFLAGGAALLGLTYGLMASSLPAHAARPASVPTQAQRKLRATCQESAAGKPLPPSVLAQCKKAFAEGARAGSQSQRDRALHSLLLFSLIGLGGMTVVSGGLGWVVSGRVLRPVRVITETARRASGQHLGERIALAGARDELKELADTFDDMLDRLDQAFSAQQRFVASASHELRTPLTLMRTAIDVTLAKPAPTAGQLRAMAVRVRRSADRAEALIDALLTLAVSDQASAGTDPLDLATAAEDALDGAAASIAGLSLRVDARLEPAETAGELRLVERLVANLVDNAVRHNEPGGWIRLRTWTGPGPDSGAGSADGASRAAFLEIANSGPVVPPEEVPALFEPFRRLSGRAGPADGAGLGLSIARSVAVAHAAAITATSGPGGGLTMRVTFPGRPGQHGREEQHGRPERRDQPERGAGQVTP
ncbi:MAG TPA: HAMP domain-containing sensor histidine kinase [Streptosporangiaceae bacterium]|nr:HAMP domain-containing sensor histidine kinase [Streptosporangiaceae bacterium]